MSYLGKGVAIADSYPKELDAEPQNDLQTAWDEQERHYEEKSGRIEINGKPYDFKVSFIDMRLWREGSDFPTNRRAITEVAPDLSKRSDIVVPVLPGWGETSAQFEGDFLELVLEVLETAGYKNPKIIGINVSGRGTPDYLRDKNKQKISGIGLMNEIVDAGNIAEVLIGRNYFGDRNHVPEVALLGHSMGSLNAISFLKTVNAEDSRARKLLAMMPAVDGPLAMFRAKFLWAVRKQVPQALRETISRSGALELGEEDYFRIMFGNPHFRDREQFMRSLPDSSRRFLELTLNMRRRLNDVFVPNGPGKDVDVTVWKGGHDELIPDSATHDFSGDSVRIDELPDLSHSIPFRLRGNQREQIREALQRFFVGVKL